MSAGLKRSSKLRQVAHSLVESEAMGLDSELDDLGGCVWRYNGNEDGTGRAVKLESRDSVSRTKYQAMQKPTHRSASPIAWVRTYNATANMRGSMKSLGSGERFVFRSAYLVARAIDA